MEQGCTVYLLEGFANVLSIGTSSDSHTDSMFPSLSVLLSKNDKLEAWFSVEHLRRMPQ